MQTGQLDTTGLLRGHVQLTPAADIYSLAKTTYTLLAGESPRPYAQHPITDLPLHLREAAWGRAVLRVLERATQTHAERRYRTVEEFWDELADASLPPTRPLQMVPANVQELRRKPSADLSVEPDEDFTEAAPPRPQFDVPDARHSVITDLDTGKRPRIVVPIDVELERQREQRAREELNQQRARGPLKNSIPPSSVLPVSRKRRALVALGLILAFSGMLLATHKYVTTRWNPLAGIQRAVEPPVIGRQGVTTTDVNLRPIASATNGPIGLAESGSKVKVLAAENNWYEVQVMEHGRPKSDPYSSDRGWVNKRFVKFD